METKDKILTCARELFARFGFHGTSVRRIASECCVNIASINYHFKSKEALYWNVVEASFKHADLVSGEIFKRSSNVKQMAMGLFECFQKESEMVRNTMRLLLSDQFSAESNSKLIQKIEQSYAPPGGEYLAQLIVKEVPYTLSREGLLWGVKAVFSTVFHWSMMSTTVTFPELGKKNPLFRPEQIRRDVEQMIEAHMTHLREHPEIFGNAQPKGSAK